MWSSLQEAYDYVMGIVGDLTGGVNDIFQLAQGAGRLKSPDIESGEEGGNPRDSDDAFTGDPALFTGVALLHPPVTIDGVEYRLVGMEDGVLQAGISALGKIFAAVGAVVIDSNGISLSPGSSFDLGGHTARISTFFDASFYNLQLMAGYFDGAGGQTNGDAETGDTTGWTVTATDGNTLTAVTTEKHSGSYSFQGYIDTGVGSCKMSQVVSNASAVEFWLKAEELDARITVSLAGISHIIGDIPSNWTKYTLVERTLGSTTVEFDFTGQPTAFSNVWIDDIKIFSTTAEAVRFPNITLRSDSNGTVELDADTVTNGGLVVNETGLDKDTRIEGDTATNLVVVDASADSFEIGTTTQGALLKVAPAGNVVNEAGADIDTRIEGDTDANLVFVDASADRVGIGVAAPGSKLDVAGSFQCDSITNDTGLAAGTYTPTPVNITNAASSTGYVTNYMRVGSMVTLSGKITIDPTAAGAVVVEVPLPVASAFANNEDGGGAANSPSVAGLSAACYAATANDRMGISWIAVDTASRDFYFTFTYRII